MGDGLDVHETTAGVKQNTEAARRADITAGSAGGPPASILTDNPAGQLTSETLATGLARTNTYDSLLRRSSLTLQPFNSSTLYSYDNASRLGTLSVSGLHFLDLRENLKSLKPWQQVAWQNFVAYATKFCHGRGAGFPGGYW